MTTRLNSEVWKNSVSSRRSATVVSSTMHVDKPFMSITRTSRSGREFPFSKFNFLIGSGQDSGKKTFDSVRKNEKKMKKNTYPEPRRRFFAKQAGICRVRCASKTAKRPNPVLSEYDVARGFLRTFMGGIEYKKYFGRTQSPKFFKTAKFLKSVEKSQKSNNYQNLWQNRKEENIQNLFGNVTQAWGFKEIRKDLSNIFLRNINKNDVPCEIWDFSWKSLLVKRHFFENGFEGNCQIEREAGTCRFGKPVFVKKIFFKEKIYSKIQKMHEFSRSLHCSQDPSESWGIKTCPNHEFSRESGRFFSKTGNLKNPFEKSMKNPFLHVFMDGIEYKKKRKCGLKRDEF